MDNKINKPEIKIHAFYEGNATKDAPAPSKKINKEVGQLALDIFYTNDEIIILAPIAGVKANEITLSITEDVLTIQGKRTERYEVQDSNYYTKECFFGSFSRSIVLPKEADVKTISASFDDNVLEIHIKKREIEKNKIIKINA
ncbi:MAG: Hsp20/alpha crystallin family protein [Candidatus Gracilibacteria bacterium]|jgi:HSP20 family protein